VVAAVYAGDGGAYVTIAPAFGYARLTSGNSAPDPLHRRSATGVAAWQQGQKITRS
jgi:hypothetical protein